MNRKTPENGDPIDAERLEGWPRTQRQARRIHNALFHALLILLVVLPYPRGSTFDLAWLGMTLILSLLAITWLWSYARGLLRPPIAFRKSLPMILLFAFWLLWQVLQLLPWPIELLQAMAPLSAAAYRLVSPEIQQAPISVDVAATEKQLLLGTAYLLLFCLLLLLVDNTRRLRQLATWLVLGGVAQALLAAFLSFSEQHLFYVSSDHSAQGSFANRNQLAGYLTQSLAIGIGLMLANMRPQGSSTWRERLRNMATAMLSGKIRLRTYLVIMVITLVLTHSRMGNTAFFAAMTVTGLLALLLMKRPPRSTVILLASLILIDIAIVSQWFGLDRLQQRFQRLNQETIALDTRINTLDRIDTSLYSRNLHRDAGFAGTGSGTYFAVFPAYQGADQPGFFQHAHNDYLEFLTDTGWVGLTLLGAMTGFCLYTALRALRRRRHRLLQGMAFSSVMGIVAMLIHSSADFNLRVPATAALFMVILALAFLSLHLPGHRRPKNPH